MKVLIEKINKTINAEAKTVKDLLAKLKLNSTIVIVTRNNEIILESEKLNNDDKIKILSVISGG